MESYERGTSFKNVKCNICTDSFRLSLETELDEWRFFAWNVEDNTLYIHDQPIDHNYGEIVFVTFVSKRLRFNLYNQTSF